MTDENMPRLPEGEIDENGRLVPKGTMERRRIEAEERRLREEADNELNDTYDDTSDDLRGSMRYRQSRGYRERMTGSRKDLSQHIQQYLSKERKRYNKSLNKPASEGWRGKLNTLPFMAVSAATNEKRARTKRHHDNVRKIHESALDLARQSIAKAPLDILDGLPPVVSVGAEKGGAGKTTTIIALAQFFSESLMSRSGENKTALLVDLNPDRGTFTERIPGMKNLHGTRMDTAMLGNECLRAESEHRSFNAMDHTYPTQWDNLVAVPCPVERRSEDRLNVGRDVVEAIYRNASERISAMFIDNGTRRNSPQNKISTSLSSAHVLVIQASENTATAYSEIDGNEHMSETCTPFQGITKRTIAAIVVQSSSDRLRKSAQQLKSDLAKRGVPAFIVPYEKNLADGRKIILQRLSVEYRSAIAALAFEVSKNLNKAHHDTLAS